jgi:hypothetical protein
LNFREWKFVLHGCKSGRSCAAGRLFVKMASLSALLAASLFPSPSWLRGFVPLSLAFGLWLTAYGLWFFSRS